MIGLCIAERYYMLGKCRIEYFPSEKELNQRRAQLDQGVTSWILGEVPPKRKTLVCQ